MQKSSPEWIEGAAAEIIKARTMIKQMRIQQDSAELRTLQTLLDRALVALNSRKSPDGSSR